MRRAVAVGVLAFLAASCGGGDGGGLSEAEFRDRANEICAELDRESQALGQPGSPAEAAEQLAAARRLFASGLADLRQLHPPEELKADYERLLQVLADSLAVFERMERAAEEGDFAEVNRIAEEAQREAEDPNRIAQRLGLDDCASD